MGDMAKPITELSNEFSSELDGKLSALEFLKILRACDSQIFSGWKGYSSLFDEDILNSCEFVSTYCSQLVSSALADPGKKVAIVMTGCGTSGRIAFQTARRYNRILASAGIRPLFHYLISGGDSALLLSDELPEDDPIEGAEDLESLIQEKGSDGTFLIGVTCGLSAPYVAGQINHALEHPTKTVGAAVMGFNPVNLSRNAVIEKATEKWTFRDIARKLEKASQAPASDRRFAVLNPVVGPEPIAGSSRMKGGSATAVLLDAICLRTLELSQASCGLTLLRPSDCSAGSSSASISSICLDYQSAHSKTYCSGSQNDALPSCMRQAAKSLRSGGRVLYVGAKSAGCMAFIDASEMPDTYGSPFDQIRGFVEGGWGENGVDNAGGDISHISGLHRISYDNFRTDLLPTLGESDTVVVTAHNGSLTPDTLALADDVKLKSKLVFLCVVNKESMTREAEGIFTSLTQISHCLTVINVSQDMEGISDYCLKLLLNALSTYAQAAGRGAVYKGLMVTTGPANDKIYNRCVEIISHTVSVSLECAEISLLRAIHKVDDVPAELLHKPRSYHIAASILPPHMRHCAQTILPLSMLLATDQWTVNEAIEALQKEPRVSILLDQTVLKKIAESSKNDESQHVILFDLGGTNIRAASAIYLNAELKMNSIYSRAISNKSEDSIKGLLSEIFDHVLQKDGISREFPPRCVVIAQPGVVNEHDGSIDGLANFPWSSPFPMMSVLKNISGCDNIIMTDDCDAALYGEMMSSNRESSMAGKTVVMLTVGTGVGTSLFYNDAIYKGARRLIEGGHMIIHPDGLSCPCGQQGCLEMYCSGTSIGLQGQALNILQAADEAVGKITAEDVIREAHAGNAIAIEIVKRAAKDLALGFVNVCRLYDPNVIIVGGGLGPELLHEAKKEFLNLSWKLHDDGANIDIVPVKCEESGLSGCLALAKECFA